MSMLEEAGDSCIGSPDTMPDVYKELLEALRMELGIIDEDIHYGY